MALSTNIKVGSTVLGVVLFVALIEHLCCLLGESYGHEHHKGMDMSAHQMPMSHAAQLIQHLTGKPAAAPCERVASIEWIVETNFTETSSAAEHVENKIASLFPNAMLHTVETTSAAPTLTVSFELHATSVGTPDWSPLNASLCESPCSCLTDCFADKLGWKPLGIRTNIHVDTTANVVPLRYVANGWLNGPSRKGRERAAQALWWHLNKNGHRATVEFTDIAEVSLMQTNVMQGMAHGGVRMPVEVRADVDVQALLKKQGTFSASPWTSESWSFEVGYSGAETTNVLP